MMNRAVLRALKGESVSPVPIWMMRQAGRYLPEYRETRSKAGSFLDLCYTPDFAVEVTLQPIRRFGFDASILFSDILVIPDALKRGLRFEEGRGPLLEPIAADEIASLDASGMHAHLAPVYETVKRLRAELPDETTLLGFCGAPWTVATYMIAGHGTPDQAPARLFSYRHTDEFAALMSLLTDMSADYLVHQIDAGADAVQVFDSWSGVLDEASFEAWCLEPIRAITAKVKAAHPDTPVIGFPKGAGSLYDRFAAESGVDAIGLDWSVPLSQAKRIQATGKCVQGNLDPMRLVAGGRALDEGIDAIIEALADGPFVFNLGHGVTPDTPVEHVARMVERVHGARR
ncbi:MAG: uroporphyrinogen decarboxylase [Brucellaceae bacterium]|nr:uroporphyrinogen decarboxylase [Brucellaceae bacterium]